MDPLIFNCPWCSGTVIVYLSELNCKIFRHASYRKNLRQVPPHLAQNECERLVSSEKVYGCCKPFEIKILKSPIESETDYSIERCEYK